MSNTKFPIVMLSLIILSSFIIFITNINSYAEPTNEEQYMLELINRARLNPALEGIRLATFYNRPELEEIFANYPSTPPLAFNEALAEAARNHNNYMKTNNLTGHGERPEDPGYTGGNSFERVLYTGFQGQGAGENLSYGYNSTLSSHDNLIIDDDVPELGHRHNILSFGENRNYQEIGINIIEGGPLGGLTTTQEFGAYFLSYIPKVLGVVYIDYNGNNFYDPGEGMAGVKIVANPGGYYTHTTSSGGYSLPIQKAGNYTITASGGNLGSTYSSQIAISSNNVKVDFFEESSVPLVINIPDDYYSIQQGIKAAVSGNTIIHIAPGIYSENLTLTKGIVLEGEGPDNTIIDGQATAPVIEISDTIHPCNIRNLTLKNGKTTSSYSQGAGINCRSSELQVNNTLIVGNTGDENFGVGAIYAVDSTISLINVTISDNTSKNNVHGFGYSNSSVTILNSIIRGNGAGGYFDLYGFDDESTIDISYSNLGQQKQGIGNISQDPGFVNVSSGNYHLKSTSPCKNAGNPDSIYNDTDNTRNDMGAYGGVISMWSAPIEENLPGDMNGDNQITPQDALIIFKCYLGIIVCPTGTDVNGDGNTTPADALCVFNKYVGRISCLD